MSPFCQTLLRSLQVPELEPEPEPEPEPELEPELEVEPVDAGGFEAGELAGGGLAGGELAGVELPVLTCGELAGTTCAAAAALGSHLPPWQISFQLRFSKVPGGYEAGSFKSARFWRRTSARSRLCLCSCWCAG